MKFCGPTRSTRSGVYFGNKSKNGTAMKNLKIAGVSIWIWSIGLIVCVGAGLLVVPKIMTPQPLEIIKKELWKNGNNDYSVKGQVFNPRKAAVRNVSITFKMMETKVSANESTTKAPRGKAFVMLDYIPAGATVDFTALCDVRPARYSFFEIEGVEFSEGDK